MKEQDLLERKRRIGTAASYGQIAKRTGHSRQLIQKLLTGSEIAFAIDRPGILRKVEKALLEIEIETLDTAA